MQLRSMQPADYDEVYALWQSIEGFGIRSLDDSRAGITRFLQRNPTTSVVAAAGGRIIGSILCGHDGRTGTLYHVCVAKGQRRGGVGQAMVAFAVQALKREHISKVSLHAFTDNAAGNAFWQTMGWERRRDLNNYEYTLNADNITAFVENFVRCS